MLQYKENMNKIESRINTDSLKTSYSKYDYTTKPRFEYLKSYQSYLDNFRKRTYY